MKTKFTFLEKINLLIRSLIFFIFTTSATFFYSFLCLLARPLSFSFRHKMIMAFTRLNIQVLKIVCRINYTVEGLENIPQHRTGIIMSKHQSVWETFFLPTLFHQTAIILKRELLWVPFFGWGLAITDPIAINRSNTQSAMEQIIKKGKQCLEQGRWILVFPEGTRIPFGKVGKYKLGGARLAVQTGHPVIPIAHNAGRYWSKRSFLKIPGTIRVVIGPLIESKGRTPEEVILDVKTWIEREMESL